MAEKQKRMRVNPNHWELLLNFLEAHPELLTGKFVCVNAKQRSQELWKEVTDQLNALGLGKKSPEKWKIALQDWKYKVKLKIANIKTAHSKTGGGPPTNIQLNQQEERLMSIVGWSSIAIETIPESCIPPQSPSVQNVELSTGQNVELSTGQNVELPIGQTVELSTVDVESPPLDIQNVSQTPTAQSGQFPSQRTPARKRKLNDADEIIAGYQEETIEVLRTIATNVADIAQNQKDTMEVLKTLSTSVANVADHLNNLSKLMEVCVEKMFKKT